MNFSQSTNAIEEKLIQWALERNNVRAILLTSTRAIPQARVDALSDYDVILVVEEIEPFVQDRTWLQDFGEVLVVYWDPVHPDPDFGIQQSSNVTQYADGLKIDFTLWPVTLFQKIAVAPKLLGELDAGYRVLLDKEGVTAALRPPTGRAYVPTRPTCAEYQTWVNDFWSDAPYVAKCLWRDELLPAKWCLDYDMKHVYLRRVLEWLVQINHDWALPVGSLGKGLKHHLPPEIWDQLAETYVGAAPEENWTALFKTLRLFRQVATEVGAHLGYEYPHDLDQRVTAYVKQIQAMTR